MRWLLLTRFEVLKKHSHSRARMSFSGSEDFFADHYPQKPSVPQTLMIEMIAQTGGVLYGLDIDFAKEVILAKIDQAEFPVEVLPPCELVVEARIEEESDSGVWISGTVRCQDQKVAAARLMLITTESLRGDGQMVVFNKRFMDYFDIVNVAKKNELIS
jgi:3-hydroxyacyl-[acyl-carrier-protein] dehydratase